MVLFHYWPHLAVAGMPPLVAKGYLGVELFFVLSGFILCHVYLPQVEAGGFRYGDFLWTRLARIYPMHLVTLIGMGLMAGGALAIGLSVDPNVLSFAALPANLTLTQAWGLAPGRRLEPPVLVDLGRVVRLSRLPGLRGADHRHAPLARRRGRRDAGLPGRALCRLSRRSPAFR